ncbi:VIT1/CCC1 transporter family protein [Candidatus Micrarchaeota archaeon]|nr:VIT1/CCC1 transporter family protein [Candidatus Micrarchaeota archaeon]
MTKGVVNKPFEHEPHSGINHGSFLRQIILGGQDGLVNVLGIVLGVAGATGDAKIVIIAGLAATAAESISMAAVAYTSIKAEVDYYFSELAREKQEIKDFPEVEREEIKLIYMKKGFKGKELETVVNKICSDEKVWLDIMMAEELGLAPVESKNPVMEGVIVGASAVVGSLIPLIPFFFLPLDSAIIPSIVISAVALFLTGAYKGKTTIGNWFRSGVEMMVIGFVAAMAGYLIGLYLGITIL